MFFRINTLPMLLTLSFALPLKVSPSVVSEQQEQKQPLVRSQVPQDPVPPTHTTRQPRSHPLASGSQTKARTLDLGGPAVPQLKNSNNTPAPTRPQTVASSSVTINAITKDDTDPGPSSSSTSGTSLRKSGKSKKVRRVYYLACIYVLTRYHRSRFRRQRTQQLKQLLHRKMCRQSKILFKNLLLCNVTK